mmetsp:Transcript_57900/g.80362  ORF Transcript_57900/g.80362 Transcript_57900/m.80362 type:complete len:169 (+) Transcript_57900:212-718(+)
MTISIVVLVIITGGRTGLMARRHGVASTITAVVILTAAFRQPGRPHGLQSARRGAASIKAPVALAMRRHVTTAVLDRLGHQQNKSGVASTSSVAAGRCTNSTIALSQVSKALGQTSGRIGAAGIIASAVSTIVLTSTSKKGGPQAKGSGVAITWVLAAAGSTASAAAS